MRNQYIEPTTLKEACDYLKSHATAVPLAGGTDVMVRYNKRVNQFDTMVNLKNLDELNGEISETDSYVCIGTLAKHNVIATNTIIKKYFPALVESVSNIGTNQIRNLGTIGGNICNASPCADSVAILAALKGSVVLSDGEQEREVSLQEFFTGPGKTVKEPGEILTSVHIPIPSAGQKQYFEKIGRRKSAEISVVNIGMTSVVTDGVITDAEIVLGSVGPKIICVDQAKSLMVGKKPEEVDKEAVVSEIAKEIKPISDIRATAEYRIHVAGVLGENALRAVL